MLEPGSPDKIERRRSLVRLTGSQLNWLPIFSAIQEVPEPSTVRKHPEEFKTRTVPHESDLGYFPVVVKEAAIAPEPSLLDRWNGLYQSPEVTIEYPEVRIHAVVRENGSFSCPA
jgi:hypothetical protein